MKNNFTIKIQSNTTPYVSIAARESSILPTVLCVSNTESLSLSFYSSSAGNVIEQELFSFIDFLDSNLINDNIVSADEEQLIRIASLVDGVEFE